MSVLIEQQEIEAPSISEKEGKRRESLLRAAEIIEKNGWTQRSVRRKTGEVCLLGAVMTAEGYFEAGSVEESCHIYGVRTEEVLGVPRYFAWEWNDAEWRHAEDVTRLLRAMANGKTFREAMRNP